jgi:hypothetical protein
VHIVSNLYSMADSSISKLTIQDLAASAYAIQPVCFVWATQVLVRENDDAARAVILYSMNGMHNTYFAFCILHFA